MNVKAVMFIILCLLSNEVISQISENVNPKNTWYFGAEVGINNIRDFNVENSKLTFQGGLLAEYYFAKQWSLSGKVKYFETGISFYQAPTGGGWFGSSERHGTFRGTAVTIPLNIKWEFRVYKNLKANLKLGYGYTIETKSEYINYSENMPTEDYSKSYDSTITGFGLNYFINKKMAVCIDYEYFIGTSKGYRSDILGNVDYYTRNIFISVGIKYNFKNETAK